MPNFDLPGSAGEHQVNGYDSIIGTHRLTDADSLTGSYWNHPAHQALLAEIDSACAERFAIDFSRNA